MKGLRIAAKIGVLPLMAALGIIWFLIKCITGIYSVIHGVGIIILVILCLVAAGFQMWPQFTGLALLGAASFLFLIAGGAIQGLIEFTEGLLADFLRS